MNNKLNGKDLYEDRTRAFKSKYNIIFILWGVCIVNQEWIAPSMSAREKACAICGNPSYFFPTNIYIYIYMIYIVLRLYKTENSEEIWIWNFPGKFLPKASLEIPIPRRKLFEEKASTQSRIYAFFVESHMGCSVSRKAK